MSVAPRARALSRGVAKGTRYQRRGSDGTRVRLTVI